LAGAEHRHAGKGPTTLMEEDFEYKEVSTGLPAERALDVAAVLANLVPLIGGSVANIISGISGGRREQRVLAVIQAVSDDLRDFHSKVSEEYVKTEDFEELLENTARRAAQERSEEKRQLYGRFLTTAIKHPGGDYEEQLRVLKTLEEISLDHLQIILALSQTPESGLGIVGSPIQTLRKRLPSYSEAQIEQLVSELNERRLTSLSSLRGMMTPQGAADLRHAVTPYGKRFLSYLQAD
jgi:hypothetical protein